MESPLLRPLPQNILPAKRRRPLAACSGGALQSLQSCTPQGRASTANETMTSLLEAVADVPDPARPPKGGHKTPQKKQFPVGPCAVRSGSKSARRSLHARWPPPHGPPDARRPHVAEYEPDSQLELRPGFGQKTARGRRRIKLTTVEAAPQQLLRSGSSARGGRAGSGSAREQDAEMEDREARGTEVDESLFVGSPRSSGPRRNGAFSCTSAPVGGILTWPVRGRGGAWRWSGLVDHG